MPLVVYDDNLSVNWSDAELERIRTIKARKRDERNEERRDERLALKGYPHALSVRNEAIRLLWSTELFTVSEMCEMFNLSEAQFFKVRGAA
jgi:hypothetical protein